MDVAQQSPLLGEPDLILRYATTPFAEGNRHASKPPLRKGRRHTAGSILLASLV